MLCRVNAGLEVFETVPLQDGHLALVDDGALVVLHVGQVDGDAGHLVARLEGVLDGMGALVRRQQGGVQVDHAVGVGQQQGGGALAHVAGHDHVVDLGVAEGAHHGALDLRRALGVVIGGEDHGVEPHLLRLGDALGAGVAGHDAHDLGVEAALLDGLSDGHHVRAGAGDEDGDPQRRVEIPHYLYTTFPSPAMTVPTV